MAEIFASKWLDFDSQGAKCGTDKTDKINSVSSVSSLPSPSRNHFSVDSDDPTTWPEYVRWIGATTREHFGDKAARRQVAAEIAFLNWRARAEGWVIVDMKATAS